LVYVICGLLHTKQLVNAHCSASRVIDLTLTICYSRRHYIMCILTVLPSPSRSKQSW